jgi:hypothetical protein
MVPRTGSGTLSQSSSCSLAFRWNESRFSWDIRVSASPRDTMLRGRMLGNAKSRQICGAPGSRIRSCYSKQKLHGGSVEKSTLLIETKQSVRSDLPYTKRSGDMVLGSGTTVTYVYGPYNENDGGAGGIRTHEWRFCRPLPWATWVPRQTV